MPERIPAWYEKENGRIYLKRPVGILGIINYWLEDAEQFIAWKKKAIHAVKDSGDEEANRGCPFDWGLCKEHEGEPAQRLWKLHINAIWNARYILQIQQKPAMIHLEKIMEMYKTAFRYGGHCSIQLSGGDH